MLCCLTSASHIKISQLFGLTNSFMAFMWFYWTCFISFYIFYVGRKSSTGGFFGSYDTLSLLLILLTVSLNINSYGLWAAFSMDLPGKKEEKNLLDFIHYLNAINVYNLNKNVSHLLKRSTMELTHRDTLLPHFSKGSSHNAPHQPSFTHPDRAMPSVAAI